MIRPYKQDDAEWVGDEVTADTLLADLKNFDAGLNYRTWKIITQDALPDHPISCMVVTAGVTMQPATYHDGVFEDAYTGERIVNVIMWLDLALHTREDDDTDMQPQLELPFVEGST